MGETSAQQTERASLRAGAHTGAAISWVRGDVEDAVPYKAPSVFAKNAGASCQSAASPHTGERGRFRSRNHSACTPIDREAAQKDRARLGAVLFVGSYRASLASLASYSSMERFV